MLNPYFKLTVIIFRVYDLAFKIAFLEIKNVKIISRKCYRWIAKIIPDYFTDRYEFRSFDTKQISCFFSFHCKNSSFKNRIIRHKNNSRYKIQSYFSAEYHWYDNFYIPDTSKIYSDMLIIVIKLLFVLCIAIETEEKRDKLNEKKTSKRRTWKNWINQAFVNHDNRGSKSAMVIVLYSKL